MDYAPGRQHQLYQCKGQHLLTDTDSMPLIGQSKGERGALRGQSKTERAKATLRHSGTSIFSWTTPLGLLHSFLEEGGHLTTRGQAS